MDALDWHRQQTIGLIDENPIDVVLTRRARVPDGQGGWIYDASTALPPQRVRIFPRRSAAVISDRAVPEGIEEIPEYVMVALPEADVSSADTFPYDGSTFRVSRVIRTAWRVRAEVVRHAA